MKSSLSIRFDDVQTAKLKELADKYRVPQSVIVNWALEALSDYVDAHKGRAVLPINFDEFWTSVQRTADQRDIALVAEPHGKWGSKKKPA